MLLKNAPASGPGDVDADAADVGWCRLLVRCRPLVWAFAVLVHLACFNGLWRVGTDSALYRGVGESLAAGRGYTFAGEVNDQIYPGLPLLVAGSRLVFGQSIVPVLIVISLSALGTLWFAERLVRLRHPAWMGLAVVIGMSLSVWWLRSSVELMTDAPFAFGAAMALYGLEQIRLRDVSGGAAHARSALQVWRGTWPSIAVLLVGLLIAALMRPTFWVIAVAWAIYAAIQLVWPRKGSIVAQHRRTGVLVLLGIACVVTAIAVAAPKTMGRILVGGEYKTEFVARLGELSSLVSSQRLMGIAGDLNNCFFGQTMGPPWLATILAIVLLLGLLRLVRGQLLWVLPIVVMLMVAVVASSVPRYYLFVLPTLWLSWAVGCARFSLLFRRWPALRATVLWACVVIPLVPNLGRVWLLIVEQRTPDVAWLRTGADREETFYASYRDGVVPRLRAISDLILAKVPPGEDVIAPSGNIIAYYSGRRILGERAILLGKPSNWARNVRDCGASKMIFPRELYDSDEQLHEMIRRYIIRPIRLIAHSGRGDYLAEISVYVPRGEWRSYDGSHDRDRKLRRASAAQEVASEPSTKPATHPTKKKKKPATFPTAQSKKNPATHLTTTTAPTSTKKKDKKPAVHAATQPATQPITQATTAPTKKKKKKPVVHATTQPTAPAMAPPKKKQKKPTSPATSPTTSPTTSQATQPTTAVGLSWRQWPLRDAMPLTLFNPPAVSRSILRPVSPGFPNGTQPT
jgi:hypothetical protein